MARVWSERRRHRGTKWCRRLQAHNQAKARTGVGATAEEEDRKEEMEEKEREEDAATVWPGTLVEASRPELEGLFHR